MTKDGKKQRNLPEMPERTAFGKRVIAFLMLKDKIDKDKETFETLRTELVIEFKKRVAKKMKPSICVDGRVVSYKHLETEQISIKNPEK